MIFRMCIRDCRNSIADVDENKYGVINMGVLKKLERVFSCYDTVRYVAYLQKYGARIGKYTTFISPRSINFDIGRAAFISIGENTVICAGVSLIAHDYSWKNLVVSKNALYPSGGKAIEIGNNCFIGANSTILGGVRIGDNAIVAAGSVVCKDVLPDTVVGGNPAREIMTLEEYAQKRKQRYIEEAKENAQYIWRKKDRKPTIEEMRNFLVLFMPRTPDNIRKYILKYNMVGLEKEKYERSS